MGVLKNGVGRPSNEVKRKRNILKVVCVILVVIIIGLICYILNDKGIIKVSDDNKVTEKNKKKDNKYSKLEFLRDTKAAIETDGEEVVKLDFKIEGGKLIATSSNDKEIKLDGISGNLKYVSIADYKYAEGSNDNPYLVVVNDEKEVFIGEIKDYNISFNKIKSDKKIKDVYILKKYDSNYYVYDLYLLTDDDLLRYRDKEKYENRKELSWAPWGGPSNIVLLDYEKNNVSVISDENVILKYDDKTLLPNKVSGVFELENNDGSITTYIIYDSKILKIENESEKIKENLKLYNNKIVKSASYEEKEDNVVVNITYEDDTKDEFNVINTTEFEK